jgi:two-component system, cell cycle sensor histidine kinase and response regulator CckA
MSERVGESPADPIIDRSERLTGVGRLLVLACGLVGAALAFAVIQRDAAEPFVLGLLGILAVIGVFTLFAGAIGLLRFAGRGQGNALSRVFMDALGEGVVVTDRDGRIVYANRAYADLIGAEAERDVRAVERVLAGDPAASEAIYRLTRALREGRAGDEEVRLPRPLAGAVSPDAGAHWYRIQARPLSLRSGRQTLSAWTLADISKERARQEAVFLELQHVIDYLDHAPAGFLSAEPDGRIVYLNATLAEWLGIDLAGFEPGGLTLSDIVRGEEVVLLAAGAADTDDGRARVIDLDLVKRNGHSLPVRLHHRVPRAADGAPGATRTLVLNRSPGEESGEALRAAEVRFTRFFNNTPIAIAAVDGQGRIGRTNVPFLKLLGEAAGSGRHLADLVDAGDRGRIETALAAAAAGAGVVPPIDAALASGRDRSARFYLNPVEDRSGGEEAVIVNIIETTEQRALERQFAQSQKMDTVGQLAGGVAHDFNNVLTAIIGFSDLLLANHRPSDPSFQDIMNIKQNANRAAGLVRQLLAFSRRQTLRPQVLWLGEVLSELSILLARLLGENVKLEFVHGRDLWPIKADLNQFETVIINLAVNARDAMPDGGTMTVRTRNLPADEVKSFDYKPLPETDYVLVEVEDTGIGMLPEVQEKIFEPFFTTKEVGKGTGLGLSTVYGIVKQTGAHIYVASEVGKGTVFRIFLPRHVPEEGELVVGAASDDEAEIADLTGSASILLVEDEEAVRAFAARALAARGYKIYEAQSGIEALEVMDEAGGKIDLVVSDVVMPELDGPSLLKELRKKRPDLKIIFISGYAEDAFKKNLPEGEEFQFLPKPFSLKQLAIAVKEALGR